MAEQGAHNQQIVDRYFKLVREIRAGKQSAVRELTSLWDADGVLEFVGAPPVTATFKGKAAIHTLYNNRVKAVGMPVELESKKGREEVALSTVESHVENTRVIDDDRVVAGWATTVGTKDGRGFQVSGSHAFTFLKGKISNLKIVVSPKHDEAPNLTAQALAINDIGRLALAAWLIVA